MTEQQIYIYEQLALDLYKNYDQLLDDPYTNEEVLEAILKRADFLRDEALKLLGTLWVQDLPTELI